MGEAEGKKDEADYKRLQTFPLVRVSPGGGRQVCRAHTALGRGVRSSSSAGRQWEEVKKDLAGSKLEIWELTVIHSFIHSFIQQVFV